MLWIDTLKITTEEGEKEIHYLGIKIQIPCIHVRNLADTFELQKVRKTS